MLSDRMGTSTEQVAAGWLWPSSGVGIGLGVDFGLLAGGLALRPSLHSLECWSSGGGRQGELALDSIDVILIKLSRMARLTGEI